MVFLRRKIVKDDHLNLTARIIGPHFRLHCPTLPRWFWVLHYKGKDTNYPRSREARKMLQGRRTELIVISVWAEHRLAMLAANAVEFVPCSV